MFTNTRTLRIEWGDCDPAGIVFYPRYFAMFDTSTTYLLERAIGMPKFDYLKAYNFLGHPIVETRAIFRVPNRYGEEITICLLYTSDAADDLLCVDLGGRRII